MLLKKQMMPFVLVLPVLIVATESANANILTAEYTANETVTDFNNYDFGGGVLLVIGFILYWNRRLHYKVEEKTSELTILLNSFDDQKS